MQCTYILVPSQRQVTFFLCSLYREVDLQVAKSSSSMDTGQHWVWISQPSPCICKVVAEHGGFR